MILLVPQIKSTLITSLLVKLSGRVWNVKPRINTHAVWRANGGASEHLGTQTLNCDEAFCHKHMRPPVFLWGRLCHIDEEQTFDNVCCRGLWQPAVVRCDRQ